MKFFKMTSVTAALVLSTNVNAVIINTINSQTYEWLELTETESLSRDQVEAMLIDPSSILFGYQYASRSLVEDLFYTYSAWDGRNGYHSNQNVIDGMMSLQSDFGTTYSYSYGYLESGTNIDGETVQFESYIGTQGLYGLSDECGSVTSTCVTSVRTYLDSSLNGVMTLQGMNYGWDAAASSPFVTETRINSTLSGSFLVRELIAPVPLPSALWLFGSGLIGLVALVKRKVNN